MLLITQPTECRAHSDGSIVIDCGSVIRMELEDSISGCVHQSYHNLIGMNLAVLNKQANH